MQIICGLQALNKRRGSRRLLWGVFCSFNQGKEEAVVLEKRTQEEREEARERCLGCQAPSCVPFLTVKIDGNRGMRQRGLVPPYFERDDQVLQWLWANKPGSMWAYIEDNREGLCGRVHAELFGCLPHVKIEVANKQPSNGQLEHRLRQVVVSS